MSGQEYPHPSRVTSSGPGHVTGLRPADEVPVSTRPGEYAGPGPERTWTTVGAHHVADPESCERVADAIRHLEWFAPPAELPFSPGWAIKAVIREFRIPKVTALAISSDLAPFGLYGVEGHYRNGRVRVYVLDEGLCLQPVASDHWPAIPAGEL